MTISFDDIPDVKEPNKEGSVSSLSFDDIPDNRSSALKALDVINGAVNPEREVGHTLLDKLKAGAGAATNLVLSPLSAIGNFAGAAGELTGHGKAEDIASNINQHFQLPLSELGQEYQNKLGEALDPLNTVLPNLQMMHGISRPAILRAPKAETTAVLSASSPKMEDIAAQFEKDNAVKETPNHIAAQQTNLFPPEMAGGQGGGILRDTQLSVDENGMPFDSARSEELANTESITSPQGDLFGESKNLTGEPKPPIVPDLEMSDAVPSKKNGIDVLPSDQGIDYWKSPDQLDLALQQHPNGFYDPTWTKGDGLVNEKTAGDYIRDWKEKQLEQQSGLKFDDIPDQPTQAELPLNKSPNAGKFGQGGATNTGFSEAIVDTARKLANVASDVNDFVTQMSAKFGEQIKPYAEKMYEVANQEKNKDVTPAANKVEDIIRSRGNNMAAKERDIYNTRQRIVDAVPDENARSLISEAIEKGTWKDLPESSRQVAEQIKTLYKDIGERAQKAGVLDQLLDNYVTHIIDWSKVEPSAVNALKEKIFGKAKFYSNGASPISRFSKVRKLDTFEIVQKALEGTGLELKTKDIAEIYNTYARSMERAIENRDMIDSIKRESGDSLIRKYDDNNKAPQGWATINTPQFRGYAINPEIMPQLKFVFDQIDPGKVLEGMHTLSQAVKRLNVVGSFFHAKSLIEVLYGNTGVFTTVKHLGLGGIDMIAGTKYSGITQAVDMFRHGGLGDVTDRFIKNGLILSLPEDVGNGVLTHIGKAADEITSKYGPKNSLLGDTLGAVDKHVLGMFDKVTWNYLHTGGKLFTAMKMLEDMKINHPEMSEPQMMTEISRHINRSSGGLNWFDEATQVKNTVLKDLAMSVYSPKGRMGMQILMFAPDWTISTLKTFTSALPEVVGKVATGDFKSIGKSDLNVVSGVKGMMKPAKASDFARLYQLRVALAMITVVDAINYQTSGHHLWQNNDPSRIEFKDGTSMQVAKHATEAFHFISDPDKTFANKLGFIPRAAAILGTGVKYANPNAPKLADTSGWGRSKAVLEGMTPFQLQAAMNAPTGEGIKRAVGGTLGFPIYGQTRDDKIQQNKEDWRTKAQKFKEWKQTHR